MARKRVRGLNEALDELFADYEKSLTIAMKHAAEIAKEDIDWKARSCLHEYYENYDPRKYDRTYHLEDAFIPYMNVKRAGDSVEASVGMGYWPFMLDGVYNDGSNQWRPTDGWWVLDNYLKGIHPTTDGDEHVGAAYIPIFDSQSPDDKMESYLEKYVDTFNNNVLMSFAKQISGR